MTYVKKALGKSYKYDITNCLQHLAIFSNNYERMRTTKYQHIVPSSFSKHFFITKHMTNVEKKTEILHRESIYNKRLNKELLEIYKCSNNLKKKMLNNIGKSVFFFN